MCIRDRSGVGAQISVGNGNSSVQRGVKEMFFAGKRGFGIQLFHKRTEMFFKNGLVSGVAAVFILGQPAFQKFRGQFG